MTLPLELRLALCQRVNALWYREYRTVGWLKGVPFERLQEFDRTPEDLHLIARYRRAENADARLRREMIRLFLERWLMFNVPESVGTWATPAEDFYAVGQKEALDVVDMILQRSEKNGEILAHGPNNGPANAAEPAEVPYEQLGVWFPHHLLDLGRSAFFLNVDPIAVVGMDRDVIAMLWLE